MENFRASVQYSEENSIFGRVSYYLLLEVLWEGVRWGGRLFEVGANSSPGPPLTYFNDRGGPKDFLGLTFWPKGIFLGL